MIDEKDIEDAVDILRAVASDPLQDQDILCKILDQLRAISIMTLMDIARGKAIEQPRHRQKTPEETEATRRAAHGIRED